MTIVLNADKSLGERCFPTVVCAVEVCRAVEACFDLQCEIKWVNDIYLNGKKLCGILCESSSINSKIVIGIGININKPPNGFHPEISDIAVSLSDHIKITDISKLISVIYKNIERHSPVFNIDSVIDEYKARSCVINKEIYVIQSEQKINATAVDITDRGELTIEYFDGRRENLFYGDISVKLNL